MTRDPLVVSAMGTRARAAMIVLLEVVSRIPAVPLSLDSLLMLLFEDSKAGKFMEKMGGMMGNQKMEQKGMEKREQAGSGEGQSSDY